MKPLWLIPALFFVAHLWIGLLALASNLGYAAAAAFPEAGRAGVYAASLVESLCAGMAGVAFIVVLTLAVIVGQITSAGGMALRMGLPPREAVTVGVGMCGRAEIAFILAALALSEGAINQSE